jgi:hypothetical protein
MSLLPAGDPHHADGEQTDRASRGREIVRLTLRMPGALLELAAKGSSQGTAVTTMMLVAAWCLVAGVAAGIGVSAGTALFVGLFGPVGIFMLVRVVSCWERDQR